MVLNQINSTFFSKKKKSEHKIFFLLFKAFTKIYSNLMAKIEDILFKSKKFDQSFYRNGIISYKLNFDANNCIKNAKKISLDYSITIHVLDKRDIEKLIKSVFNKETQNLLYKITGFKYSIDYLRIYENNHVDKIDKQLKNMREAHYDKSFSKNMLKIFIPLNINFDSGPLKVFYINSNKYNKINKKSTKSKRSYEFLIGNGDTLYGVLPNLCWHQEGNPKRNFSSKQIMFQLNPSNHWEFREDLYLRQSIPENKFPSLSSIFFKKRKIR